MASGAIGRKLVFHIGHQKTGTTTIQNAFATGRVRIEGSRILYPARMAHNYLKNHFTKFAEVGTAMKGRPGMPGLDDISRELAQGEYDFALFSGEAFADFDPGVFRRVMDRFFLPHVAEHSIICYVRPHAARVLSSFVEQTKIGLHDGSIAAFHEKSLRRRRFCYAAKLTPWVSAFGENFVVRPMVRQELAQGSVLHDFVHSAFGSAREVQIDAELDANESLCLQDLMILKIVQSVIAKRSQKVRLELGWAIADKLARGSTAGRSVTKLKLDRSLAERIRNDYRSDAARTDAQFFGGRPVLQTELDRAVDESALEPTSVEPSDYFSAAEIRDIVIMAEMVDDMLDHRTGEWPMYLLDRRNARLHGEPTRTA